MIHDSPHDTRCRKKILGLYAIQRYNALDFDKGHEYVSILSSIASPSEIWDEVLCEGVGGSKQILGAMELGRGKLLQGDGDKVARCWGYHLNIFSDFKTVENDWSKWIIFISPQGLKFHWEERMFGTTASQQCHPINPQLSALFWSSLKSTAGKKLYFLMPA